MPEKFEYQDRKTFYKKDMWRQMAVCQCLKEEMDLAQKNGQEWVTIGTRQLKLEAIAGFLESMDMIWVLEDRMRAAARILTRSSPSEIHFLDLDKESEDKRVAEEKACREERNKKWEEDQKKTEAKEKRKQKRK